MIEIKIDIEIKFFAAKHLSILFLLRYHSPSGSLSSELLESTSMLCISSRLHYRSVDTDQVVELVPVVVVVLVDADAVRAHAPRSSSVCACTLRGFRAYPCPYTHLCLYLCLYLPYTPACRLLSSYSTSARTRRRTRRRTRPRSRCRTNTSTRSTLPHAQPQPANPLDNATAHGIHRALGPHQGRALLNALLDQKQPNRRPVPHSHTAHPVSAASSPTTSTTGKSTGDAADEVGGGGGCVGADEHLRGEDEAPEEGFVPAEGERGPFEAVDVGRGGVGEEGGDEGVRGGGGEGGEEGAGCV